MTMSSRTSYGESAIDNASGLSTTPPIAPFLKKHDGLRMLELETRDLFEEIK